jgi:hypothetical protein
MTRWVKAEVHSPDNLDWTVKRLWVVQRPLSPEQAMTAGNDPLSGEVTAAVRVRVEQPTSCD